MTATTATDASGVEYYFTCTAGGGHDSAWQDSPTYTDAGLSAEASYTYTVMARDKSSAQNTTASSESASATTEGAPEMFYSDAFDDGDMAVNAGTGGGWSHDTRNLGTPVEQNGTMDTGRGTKHNNRGNTFSINRFDLSGGFRLTVSYSTDDLTDGRAEVGLIDAAFVDTAGYDGHFGNWLSASTAGNYGIGMNLSPKDGNQGLNLNADFSVASLSSIAFVAGAASFVLEVDADSNWSYSVNGGDAVTGTIGGDGFDFTREYMFGTYSQNLTYVEPKCAPGLTIDSVSLSPIKNFTDIGDITMDLSGGSTAAGFSWFGQSGATYGLEVTDDLTSGSWNTITNVVGTNGLIFLTGAIDQTNAFYRVKLAE
jgi:hypothetical protein